MGKFLRDKEGGMVSLNGSPVLEKKLLNRPGKECQCQKCGFANWCKGDVCFIVQQQQQQQPHFGAISATDGSGTLPSASDEDRSSHRSIPTASPTSVAAVAAAAAGSLNYLCPDCALEQGLPPEFWKKNKRAAPKVGNPTDGGGVVSFPIQYVADCTTVSRGLAYNAGDLIACFCYF
jgi:hypothetical protein